MAGEGGGILHYDSLQFEKTGLPAPPEIAVRIEPTIFFLESAAGLCERTHVIISHPASLGTAEVILKIGTAEPLTAKIPEGGAEFGETLVQFEVPADIAAGPCEIALRSHGRERLFTGEFRPEKRWKLFAGLKVHNDLG